MNLSKKTVIVTGGAGGIGEALVEKFVHEGAAVGVFDINRKAIEKMSASRPDIYCRVCDLTSHDDIETAVNGFFQKFGKIDILINNAAVVHNEMLIGLGSGGLSVHDIDTWNKVISTNLSSVFYVTRAVVQKMFLKRTKGLIVNVSSITSSGNAGQSAYSAAKAGVRALTVTWANELGAMGIRVTGIAPGYTETEATMKSMTDNVIQEWVKKIPLKRLATPQDIVEGILFLVRNDYFNGRTLEIDGGLRI